MKEKLEEILFLPQTVEVKLNSKNKSHYLKRGYEVNNHVDILIVDVLDLYPTKSDLKVKVYCQHCDNITTRNYYLLIKNMSVTCSYCKQKNRENTLLEKYGVTNQMQIKSVKDKVKKTNLERYGYENPSQSEIIKKRVKSTNLEKFGFEHPMQSEEIKNKRNNTCLGKYSVNNPTKLESIKNKIKNTNLMKYGVEYPAQSNEIKEKTIETNLSKYGVKHYTKTIEGKLKAKKASLCRKKTIFSKQQKYLCDLLNGELNLNVKGFLLDIAFPNEKIYIEYDGSGHDLSVKLGVNKAIFQKREIQRQYALKEAGWKLIRIVSRSDYLPIDDEIKWLIKECKSYLLNNNNNWIRIDIAKENQIIECSKYRRELFLNLRKLRT